MLAGAVVLALLWCNASPASYEDVWTTRLAVELGGHELSADLRGWVNHGLMTLFFLLVGLEAKRELDLGELRDRRRLIVPAAAAVGAMAAAAAVFLAFTAGTPAAAGWGTVVSTDTALALGILALVSRGHARRLRVFLLTLLVVDELIALTLLAVVYTTRVAPANVAVAIALLAALVALRWFPRWRRGGVAVAGGGMWLALFDSGVDPIVTGLVVGLATSAYPPVRQDLERSTALMRSFREQPTPELAYSARAGLVAALSANERLRFRLQPWIRYLVVPLFALANAGVEIDAELLAAALASPVTIGIVAAYLVGKPLGLAAAAWIVTRPALGGTRPTVTWPGLAVGSLTTGAGFTVSLLVATRAFEGPLLDQAKVGILATLAISPLLVAVAVAAVARISPERRARQLSATAEILVDLAENVDAERDHVRGRIDAPVTLVEYGDFECPYCHRAAPAIAALLEAHPDDVRFVWRHLPLNDVHPRAQLAAEAAEAAGAQGRFWEMHDRLLADPDGIGPGDLEAHAAALALDRGRFEADLRDRRHAARVAADVESADDSGVTGTPTLFVDGRRHHGAYGLADLEDAIGVTSPRRRSPARDVV